MRELAHFAGTSHATIQRCENGSADVAPATLARIARALRVPVAELFPTNGDAPAGGTEATQTSDKALLEVAGANGQLTP